MNRRRVVIALSSILAMGFLLTGCGGGSRANIIKISGSSSVGPLVEAEAEVFKKEMPDITVEVNQLGSSAGIKDAINGTVEIGISSRDLKEKELESGIKEKPIAYDGMSVIINNENPVQNLTMEQIRENNKLERGWWRRYSNSISFKGRWIRNKRCLPRNCWIQFRRNKSTGSNFRWFWKY